MATLYITEFARQGRDAAGYTMVVADEPAIANQTVAIGGASAQSSAFAANTAFVRVCADAVCSIEFGSNPTATTSTRRLPANVVEYFSVPIGGSFKVACITNT